MGQPYIPDLPMYTGTGYRTPFGINMPPGKVACFLSSQGADYYNDQTIASIGCAATLTDAAAQVRTGRADTIIALPGHSESLDTAAKTTALSAALVAGTKLVGIGHGTAQPTIRWAHASASLAVSVANVMISGMYLKFEGASGVTLAMSVTGSDLALIGNRILMVTDNTHKCTTGISMGATTGGDRFTFLNNQVLGNEFAFTDFLKVDGVVDGLRCCNNKMIGMGTTGNGFINVTAAATKLDICDNDIYNSAGVAAAPSCITFANVASTGICYRNTLACLSNSGLSSATGIIVAGSSVLVKFNNNYNVDVKGFSGVLTPVVTTG
jgi:hypothetical protein